MDELIQTSPITKLLVGTGIAITIGGIGVSGDYYLNPRIPLRDQMYTPYQYSEIKTKSISLEENMESAPMTFEEGEIWKAVMQKECTNVQFSPADAQRLIGKNMSAGLTEQDMTNLYNQKLKVDGCK